MHTISIDDTVRDILRRSEVTSDRLKLPTGQLPRQDYVAVNTALTKLGGKWNTSAKAHLFKSDPRDAIRALIGGQEVIDQKKEFQEFFTPDPIANKLVQVATRLFTQGLHPTLPPGVRVLEPNVGDGALLKALKKEAPEITNITAYDINEKWVSQQKALGIDATAKDFLLVEPPMVVSKRFDLVLMNPPFEKKQDAKHVLHAWNFLRPEGVLAAIISPAFLFRTEQLYKDMRSIADFLAGDAFMEELPQNTFKASGTNVRTFMIGWVKF